MIFAAAFGVAFLFTWMVVQSQGRHSRLSHDHDLSGVQKFHAVAVPRIGGIGIFAGTLVAILGLAMLEPERVDSMLVLLTCALPTFLSGLVEDFTKRVPPRWRLLLTAVSAALVIAWLHVYIDRVDVRALQWLMVWPLEAMALTVFAVTGVTNAVNLVDGFNGLASMCVLIMLAAIGVVAWQVHDALIVDLALAVGGAVLGFFVFNFPRGRIFLGDGGAYFIGFMVAELSLLLTHRNPGVSAIFPLLVCGYPIFETVFTMFRRRFVQRTATGLPDAMHLHHLVFRELTRYMPGKDRPSSLTRRNSMTSPFLWAVCACAAVPAACFWDDTRKLLLSIGLFVLGYVVLYLFILASRKSAAAGDAADAAQRDFGVVRPVASGED